jgi:CheY-like chemotaxis protein
MNSALVCPYCSRPLRWVPARWFGRGCFECDNCGEFPDLRETTHLRSVSYATDQDMARYATDQDLARPAKRDDRPRILLVDDSAEHCDLYALMLEPTASVVTASRGLDALKIAATEPLDAIVLDVLMPGIDGWEVCSRLKSSPFTNDIPVIMLTSLDAGELDSRAKQAGAEAVLVKPCPVERLALAIDKAVRSRVKPFLQTPSPNPEAVFQYLHAPHPSHSRRWTRKPVTAAPPAQLDRLPANVVNISYGGLCVEVQGAASVIPLSFDLTFPTAKVLVKAGAVWMCRTPGSWLCGAEIAQPAEAWRSLVDSIS